MGYVSFGKRLVSWDTHDDHFGDEFHSSSKALFSTSMIMGGRKHIPRKTNMLQLKKMKKNRLDR